jgi:hypothetical protein
MLLDNWFHRIFGVIWLEPIFWIAYIIALSVFWAFVEWMIAVNWLLSLLLGLFWMNDCGELLFTPIIPYVVLFFEWMISVNLFLSRVFGFFWMIDCGELFFIACFWLFLNDWLRWTAFYPYNPAFCSFFEWMITVNCILPL